MCLRNYLTAKFARPFPSDCQSATSALDNLKPVRPGPVVWILTGPFDLTAIAISLFVAWHVWFGPNMFLVSNSRIIFDLSQQPYLATAASITITLGVYVILPWAYRVKRPTSFDDKLKRRYKFRQMKHEIMVLTVLLLLLSNLDHLLVVAPCAVSFFMALFDSLDVFPAVQKTWEAKGYNITGRKVPGIDEDEGEMDPVTQEL